MEMIAPSIKPVVWIGSIRADLASFPEDVKDAIGYALYIVLLCYKVDTAC
jgi:phage-related protein